MSKRDISKMLTGWELVDAVTYVVKNLQGQICASITNGQYRCVGWYDDDRGGMTVIYDSLTKGKAEIEKSLKLQNYSFVSDQVQSMK